jgi:hypothetical protein
MSTAVSILQRLHHHRAWANEKLVEAAATLSPDQLPQPQGIGQKDLPQRRREHGEDNHSFFVPFVSFVVNSFSYYAG